MTSWRTAAMLGGMTSLVLVLFVASVALGPTSIPLRSLAESVWDHDATDGAHLIARDVRLPRALLTMMVGASLAVAGAVMQAVTRNPLAGPSILGLSGGATLASLVALIVWPMLSYNQSIVATFAGAALGYGCVLGVAALAPGGFSPTRLALAGVVVSSLFSAITQALIIAFAMSSTMLHWTVGGVTNVGWQQVTAVLPCCTMGLLGLWAISPSLSILSLGDAVALNLGLRSVRIRITATLLVLLLTGAAVAVAGPVTFVGLMTPHACRLLVGADMRRLLPLTALAGAALTMLADLVARTALGSQGELPLGVVTAVIGAPCFLWLIRSQRRGHFDADVPVQCTGRNAWSPRIVLSAAAALLFLVFMLALYHGRVDLSADAIVRTLLGHGGPQENLVLWSIRIPRLLLAVLVGVGVAVAGAIFQAVLRNDLAEPGILGVSSGAMLGVVLLLAIFGRAVLGSAMAAPLAATGGALVVALLVIALCRGSHASPRLLLTGIAVNSVVSAVTLLATLQMSSETYAFVVSFGAGSLNAADWNYIGVLGMLLLLLVPLVWSFAAMLNVLRLGDSAAMGLGVSIPADSLGLLVLGVAIGASCMAVSGEMMFLGLVAPHIARRLVGSDHTVVIPLSGLVGATLLIAADLLGRSMLLHTEIPAGILVSALGAPYFLYLLARS